MLYLTFDDGPVPGPTEFVLETLSRHNVKATFFCIGDNIHKHSPLFKEMLEQGHAVGNHTHNHLNGWKTSTEHYTDNINRCAAEINSQRPNASGAPERVPFRPPYGRITRRQIAALPDVRIVMWDVLSMDYNPDLSVAKCLRHTIKATRAGSIIVFHDSHKAEKNLTGVLPEYIEHFVSLGFTFKTLAG
jgi:peptidoglycan/xylan/chitin deacetylase (PgdA/CDA1 family)